MLDPRADLKEDTIFWQLTLACATKYKNAMIFGNLHGFRCSGARLILKDKSLVFKFSDEWNNETKEKFKKKFATPYLKEFKTIFKFIAENFEKIKDYKEYKEKDYFTEDIFSEGYSS
jgi:hypothetical protein